MTSRRQLATALADAALAGALEVGGWEVEAVRARLYRLVGRRRRWLDQLATEVIAAHAQPPADRPRELAAFVLASNAFARGRLVPGPVPRPVAWPSTPTATLHRPHPTPPIDHAGDLARILGITTDRLDGYADTRLRARRAGPGPIHHYRYRWLDRPAGPRLLEAPRPRLRDLQRTILHEILAGIPVHPACHGFVTGRSVITGAVPHAGAEVIIALDLEHFFASVTAARVWGVLRAAGFPEPTAHLLTGLTTHATPIHILTTMPAGADPSRTFRLRRWLATPHLPQGAPTSPLLANLVLYRLDRRMAALAGAVGATYTRYADDLTLSGGADLRGRTGRLIAAAGRIVRAESFRLNAAKTRVRHPDRRQSVTGVVVNRHPNVPRADYDRLKAILHDAARHGPDAANRLGHRDFRAHLLGRISWVAAVNPHRGASLRAAFDVIDWRG